MRVPMVLNSAKGSCPAQIDQAHRGIERSSLGDIELERDLRALVGCRVAQMCQKRVLKMGALSDAPDSEPPAE